MTGFIAALPMYDWPEVRAETDAQWARLRDALRRRGIDAPAALTRRNTRSGGLDLMALWRNPALLFAQTCWGPMGLGLAEHVQVIGQPDYSDCEGGRGELYSSVVVMRGPAIFLADAEHLAAGLPPLLTPPRKGEEDLEALFRSPLRGGARGGATADGSAEDVPAPADGRAVLPLELLRGKRFAFNGEDSMSGVLALEQDLAALGEGLALFSERQETGGHRASLRAVAEGRADVAAADCRSWALFRRLEPEVAATLRAVGWTARRKGLPYICARGIAPATVAILREELASAGMLAAG